VRSVDEWVVALLVTLIREGGLPKLQKLRFDQGEHAQERFLGGLARAIKARRERGLPPLTDLEGMAEAGTPTPTPAGRELISIWGCCPAEAQECLEAADARQISALEEYVGGTDTDLFALVESALGSPLDAEEEDVGSTSTDFPALRILRLVGSRGWGWEPVPFAVLWAVEYGRMPALEKLDLLGLDGGLDMVGRALKAGKLQRLRILGLANLEPQLSELIGLVDGLVGAAATRCCMSWSSRV
jgi:hypothetical protein